MARGNGSFDGRVVGQGVKTQQVQLLFSIVPLGVDRLMIEEAVERRLGFSESRRLEVARLAFLERNWGEEAARAFAVRTPRSYRRAVVHHTRPPVIDGFGCVYSLPIAS